MKVVVGQHECISRIAHASGRWDWRLVWDAPGNAALRARRANPDVLFPGDEVVLPDLARADRPCALDALNRFRVAVPGTTLRLVVQTPEGAPVDGCPYRLLIDGLPPHAGRTDGGGALECPIRPTDDHATLELGPDRRLAAGTEPRMFDLQLGALDPVSELAGVQARLNNLGFEAGQVDGIAGPLTRAGVRAFQRAAGLVVDGIPGPNTQAALEAAHGS